jgi:hypothetical protein
MARYKLFVPAQAVGAGLVYFDFFNRTGNGLDVEVQSVVPIVSGAVAVTGAVAVDLFLTRTTAVGSGGVVAGSEGTSLTAITFTAFDNSQPVSPSKISARLTPTGGATAGAVVAWTSVFTEETADASYARAPDLVRQGGSGLLIHRGTGIRVVQGAVASVGNIGFDVVFNLTAR